jgi:hypothetical protein
MADLLTLATLAKWTQNDTAEVEADPFAADLVEKVSALACYIGGHDGIKTDADGDVIPEWDLVQGPTQAPIDVQMVVLKVCKRSYENPGQVISDTVGPLSERVADVQALFMDFTDAERATLAKYNPDGDPEGTEGEGYVFTMSISGSPELPTGSPLYVGDNLQVGLTESADPREWKIPMFNPGDPGDDLNYAD